MPWYTLAIIIYFAFDVLVTIGYVGRSIKITPATAVLAVITHGLLIWAVIATAAH